MYTVGQRREKYFPVFLDIPNNSVGLRVNLIIHPWDRRNVSSLNDELWRNVSSLNDELWTVIPSRIYAERPTEII
jgi:hypothetical protein